MASCNICLTCVLCLIVGILFIELSDGNECFDMLKVPGKCEHKRSIGKCISNPWRMMSVCKKTCYCEDYNFLKFGHECLSSNEYLGNVQSERECAQLCIAKTGCKVFLLESGQNYSTCIWEKTINTSCPEGWKETKNMNAYELKGPKGVKLLPLCDLKTDVKNITTQALFNGTNLITSNATKLLLKKNNWDNDLVKTKILIERVAKYIDNKPNNSNGPICANEQVLNEELRNCFKWDRNTQQKTSAFRTITSCNLTYFSDNHSENCILNKTLKLDTGISCRYSGLNDENIETWMCLLDLRTEHQNCTRLGTGTSNWSRYLFMYKFTVPLLQVSTFLTTSEPDNYSSVQMQPFIGSREHVRGSQEIKLNSTVHSLLKTSIDIDPMFSKRHIAAVIVIVIILIGTCAIFIVCYNRRIISNFQSNNINMTDNLRIDEQYSIPIRSSDEPLNRSNDVSDEERSVLSLNDCPDCKMISTLPSAILKVPDMLYPRCSINIEEGIGKGNFGAVFKGKVRIGNARFLIAMKHPHAEMDGHVCSEEMESFLEEAKSMLEIRDYHENIVNLQGLIYGREDIENKIPKFSLMLEYCPKGDLRSYIIDHETDFKRSLKYYHENGFIPDRVQNSGEVISHDLRLFCVWACQVANGMSFLAKKHIHHGDLATRNCLLTETLVVKISDFGLARRFYQDLNDYQDVIKQVNERKKIPLRLPMKWIALEVLVHQKIVPSKSDVWSYGVLLWEIFTLGAVPYRKGIDFEQLVLELRFGVRLPPPQFCPLAVAEWMKLCFHEDPYQRPSFEELKNSMTQICSSLNEKPNINQNYNHSSNHQDRAVTYADIEMKQRYFHLKNENKYSKLLNHVKPTESSYDTTLHTRYYSTETKTSQQCPSNDDAVSSPCQIDELKCNIEDPEDRIVAPGIGNKYKRLSQRLRRSQYELKEHYYLTYPGKTSSSHHKSLPIVSSTQSCNHLYMFRPILDKSNYNKDIDTKLGNQYLKK